MIRIYIDAEFDAVRYKQHFEQAVISMGAVLCFDDKVISQFYRLVKPRYFKRLSPVVKKMTRLQNEAIMEAEPIEVVSEEFKAWLRAYGNIETMHFFSCGPDDRRTLLKNCEIHQMDGEIFDRIEDLQKEISASVFYDGKLVSSTLSLDDMKLIYDVCGLVEHNALTDAMDLMQIHQRFLQGNHQNEEQIKTIVIRKQERAALAKIKQKAKFKAKMNAMFSNYGKEFLMLTLTREVVKEFQLWESKEAQAFLHWKRNECYHKEICFPYGESVIGLQIKLDEEEPLVKIRISYLDQTYEFVHPLTYRNAHIVEEIIQKGVIVW